jgi:hypothetical protein
MPGPTEGGDAAVSAAADCVIASPRHDRRRDDRGRAQRSSQPGRNYRRRWTVFAGRASVVALGVAMTLTTVLASGIAATPARATMLQAHRATYAMSLAASAKRSEVIAANGRMHYRFARACDGWTVENRTELRLSYEGGRDVDSVWTFASWESLDGRKFRFHARYELDGDPVERIDGEARLEGRGKGGWAQFARPEERRIELPAGAVFPTEHVRLMIEAAERGAKTLAKVVFDGASIDNPYYVYAVFGALPPAAAEQLAKAAGLPLVPSWWTRMAFFPSAAEDPVPEFEISAHYRSDGIADRIVQQFHDFSLGLQLRELELVPPPDC